MARTKPETIAKQFDWDTQALLDFCANVMEDANDHGVALALSSLVIGDHDLACKFLQVRKEHVEAGGLGGELYQRRAALVQELVEKTKAFQAGR